MESPALRSPLRHAWHMPQLERLADLFGTRPFSTAEAIELGFTPGGLRHPRLHGPSRGVRTLAHPGSTHVEAALHAVPALRPGDRVSHVTALLLLGYPIHIPDASPVDVESELARGAMRRRGIRGHRYRVEHRGILLGAPGGAVVPVVSPLRALRQAAQVLPFPELVVACDHFLRPSAVPAVPLEPLPGEPRTVGSKDALQLAAARATGPGARRFRIACELARLGSESRMETLSRLRAEAAGLRDLELQVQIRDSGGRWLGRVDMADSASRSAFEYDGEQHRLNRTQYLKDIRRLERIRAAGWRVLRIHWEDLAADGNAIGLEMLKLTGRPAVPHRPEVTRLLLETWTS